MFLINGFMLSRKPKWFEYSKTTIKQWCIAILLSDQAYHLFEIFKQNAVLIGT